MDKHTHCEHNILKTQTCVACGRTAAATTTSEPSPGFDAVNRPRHYNQGKVECIDAMIEAFGIEAVQTYCRLNAFKYQWRAEYKGSRKQDLHKAIWYLRFALGDDPRSDV